MTEEEVRSMFGDADPFSDFFRTFFGGATRETGRRTRGRAGRARAGRDVEHEIDLTLEQVYHGVTQRFTIDHDGTTRTMDVRIPAGVGSGSRVRVAGEGERGGSGGTPGDLYLRVRVAPHPVFERKGADLHTRVPVPVTTAVLGGEAAVPTLAGAPVRLRIPGSTQAGQVFRLKGHGLPLAGKPNERGDLYAAIDVKVPRSVTPEERSHYEALRRLEDEAKKRSEKAVTG
jgi:curved DNA-binding protein